MLLLAAQVRPKTKVAFFLLKRKNLRSVDKDMMHLRSLISQRNNYDTIAPKVRQQLNIMPTLSTGGRSGQGGQEWTAKARMLGGAGHSALEGGEVTDDAIDMEVNKGLLAFFAEEKGAVGGVVHEEIFH